MLMMCPDRARIIIGAKARTARKAPRRLVFKICSHASGASWCSGPPNPPIPALFTRMSTRPNKRSTRPAAPSTDSRLVTSHGTTSVVPPASVMACAPDSRAGHRAPAQHGSCTQARQLFCNGEANTAARPRNHRYLRRQRARRIRPGILVPSTFILTRVVEEPSCPVSPRIAESQPVREPRFVHLIQYFGGQTRKLLAFRRRRTYNPAKPE